MSDTPEEITQEKLDAEFERYLTTDEILEREAIQKNEWASDCLIEELDDLDSLDARLIIYEQAVEIDYLRKIIKVRELRRKVQTKSKLSTTLSWEGEVLDSLHELVTPKLASMDRVIGK